MYKKSRCSRCHIGTPNKTAIDATSVATWISLSLSKVGWWKMETITAGLAGNHQGFRFRFNLGSNSDLCLISHVWFACFRINSWFQFVYFKFELHVVINDGGRTVSKIPTGTEPKWNRNQLRVEYIIPFGLRFIYIHNFGF